jgi:hypothetical protein
MEFMAKVGRNEPCPCGSGMKYKKCCLPLEGYRVVEVRKGEPRPKAAPGERVLYIEDDGLDDLSNSVLQLIRERRFDEALTVCRRLTDEFPDVYDGFERSALVHAAMGNHALAADFYRRTYDFVTAPVRRHEYDEELIQYYREQLDTERRLAGLAEGDRASRGDPERAP